MTAAIEIHDLTHRYDSVEALRGISFTVPQGQICGFLGPNGAGKSTTMRILAGIQRATSGSVRLGGVDAAASPVEAKRIIGYVPESGALYGLLSAREHLTFVADLYEIDSRTARERIDRLLALFDLDKLADRRIDSLSKGQRQKVALSTALVHDAQALLLDEPLNGLDARSALAVKEVLIRFAERGGAVLYSSHILDVVERVCHRAIVLHDGRIVADAPTTELVKASKDASLESVFHALIRSDDVAGLAGAFLETKP